MIFNIYIICGRILAWFPLRVSGPIRLFFAPMMPVIIFTNILWRPRSILRPLWKCVTIIICQPVRKLVFCHPRGKGPLTVPSRRDLTYSWWNITMWMRCHSNLTSKPIILMIICDNVGFLITTCITLPYKALLFRSAFTVICFYRMTHSSGQLSRFIFKTIIPTEGLTKTTRTSGTCNIHRFFIY